jgi:pyridoxal phosphate enzyme (YggS family)
MIGDNILQIKGRINLLCRRLRRAPEEISIVAVSKGRSLSQIQDVISCGLNNIGENRIQEAVSKYNELRTIGDRPRTIKWHMVGHLQTNKVKQAVGIFDLIQSVDSLRLAEEINKQAARINKIQNILIQINTSAEKSKFGLTLQEASPVIERMSRLKNITILGLMTIAPIAKKPGENRPYFRMLRELKDKINSLGIAGCALDILSMGMSDDFEIAIEEGANMVRLGRAIFG